jgi:hypothetical protein
VQYASGLKLCQVKSLDLSNPIGFEVFGAFPQEKYPHELEPVLRPVVKPIFNRVNIHPLMPIYSGNAVFNDKKEFLKSPDQWKGKKMRMGGKWQGIVANKWGASPTAFLRVLG